MHDADMHKESFYKIYDQGKLRQNTSCEYINDHCSWHTSNDSVKVSDQTSHITTAHILQNQIKSTVIHRWVCFPLIQGTACMMHDTVVTHYWCKLDWKEQVPDSEATCDSETFPSRALGQMQSKARNYGKYGLRCIWSRLRELGPRCPHKMQPTCKHIL